MPSESDQQKPSYAADRLPRDDQGDTERPQNPPLNVVL